MNKNKYDKFLIICLYIYIIKSSGNKRKIIVSVSGFSQVFVTYKQSVRCLHINIAELVGLDTSTCKMIMEELFIRPTEASV